MYRPTQPSMLAKSVRLRQNVALAVGTRFPSFGTLRFLIQKCQAIFGNFKRGNETHSRQQTVFVSRSSQSLLPAIFSSKSSKNCLSLLNRTTQSCETWSLIPTYGRTQSSTRCILFAKNPVLFSRVHKKKENGERVTPALSSRRHERDLQSRP